MILNKREFCDDNELKENFVFENELKYFNPFLFFCKYLGILHGPWLFSPKCMTVLFCLKCNMSSFRNSCVKLIKKFTQLSKLDELLVYFDCDNNKDKSVYPLSI